MHILHTHADCTVLYTHTHTHTHSRTNILYAIVNTLGYIYIYIEVK